MASEREEVIDVDLYADSLEKGSSALQVIDVDLYAESLEKGSDVPQAVPARRGSEVEFAPRSELGASLSTDSSQIRPGASHKSTADTNATVVRFRKSVESVALRAIRAGQVLRGFGRLLRAPGGAAFGRSREVKCIDDFWSHSNHAPQWVKILALLTHYNMVASAIAGLLGAAATVFVPLPGGWDTVHLRGGFAALHGAIASVVVLLLWPSRRRVFLDKACICQDDVEKKQQGIMSLGYFLKNSDTMLILWDTTYFSRLWCVFELAAWSKLSQGSQVKSMHMLPIINSLILWITWLNWLLPSLVEGIAGVGSAGVDTRGGQVMVIIYVLCAVCFVVASANLRKLAQLAANVEKQLQSFSIEGAECFCCSMKHIDPDSKEPIPCDRELVEACVTMWFGSKGAFNDYVKNELQQSLRHRAILPYHYVVFSAMPKHVWATIGVCSWLLRAGQPAKTFEAAMRSMDQMLLISPVGVSLALTWFKCTTRGPPYRGVKGSLAAACNVLVSTLLLAFLAIALGLVREGLQSAASAPGWGLWAYRLVLASWATYFYWWRPRRSAVARKCAARGAACGALPLDSNS